RNERNRHLAPLRARSDRVGDARRHPGGPVGRRPPQTRERIRADWNGRRGDHHAGDFPFPADRGEQRRRRPGPLRGDWHPAPLPRPGHGARCHPFGRPLPARCEVRLMNVIWIRALILVCTFSAVVLAAEVLVRWFAGNRATGHAINLRLKMIGRGQGHGETMNILRRTTSTVPEGLPPLIDGIARKFERMLMQAQVTVATSRLMLIVLVAPMAIFFVMLMLIALWWGIGISFGRILISAIFALLLGAALPLMALNFRATRKRKKMQEQFPVALDVFVRGLRAGHPIAAALDLLTVEMPDPIGSQFGLAVDEVTYGAELRDSLQSMAERWDLEDMRMFVVSLSVQSETGGNLAEILESLSRVIQERQAM